MKRQHWPVERIYPTAIVWPTPLCNLARTSLEYADHRLKVTCRRCKALLRRRGK